MESKTTRIILIVLGVLVLCCCCVLGGGYLLTRYGLGYIADSVVVQDQSQINRISDELADYDLPPGYEEEFVMNILGIQALIITNQSDGAMITMMQFNSNLYGNSEATRQQFRETFMQQYQNNDIQFSPVDQRQIDIRGEEATVWVYEGFDSQGNDFRQWVTVFEGQNGTIFLMIVGRESTWNDAEMEAFVQSID
jgi:hypothetical protein